MDKKTSLIIPEDLYWKAVAYGAKNKIKGGFKGVIVEALNELLGTGSMEEPKEEVNEYG